MNFLGLSTTSTPLRSPRIAIIRPITCCPTARPFLSNTVHGASLSPRPMRTVPRQFKDTGPLTKKRMETVDEETLAAAKDFIKRQHEAGKPFFCWWNGTRMHFRTHVKEEHKNLAGPNSDEYADGMVEHDMHVGELLEPAGRTGHR